MQSSESSIVLKWTQQTQLPQNIYYKIILLQKHTITTVSTFLHHTS